MTWTLRLHRTVTPTALIIARPLCCVNLGVFADSDDRESQGCRAKKKGPAYAAPGLISKSILGIDL
jgi:hypothetical protein